MYVQFNNVFRHMKYPAGEAHLQLRPDVQVANGTTIEVNARGFDDLAQVVVADRILRRVGRSVEWFIPYFPFARHDRRNHLGDGFELGLAMEMVRELRVVIADAHSDVVGQLRQIPQASVVDIFREKGAFSKSPVVVIPDAGAGKKIATWCGKETTVQALKKRDPETGRLSGFKVLSDDLAGRPCIIVDDICDGGGTFLGLAAELKKLNAGALILAVTHGLFTKGIHPLQGEFEHIYFFAQSSGEQVGVTQIAFQELFEKGKIQ